MFTKVILSDLIKKLPQNVRDHLFSEELTEKYSEIFASTDISDAQAENVRNLVWQVYAKQLSLPEFISATGKELKLSDDMAKKLSIQIIGFDFLPVADYLGVDVERYLKELGVDTHVFEKVVNPNEIAEELASNANLRFPDPQLDSRLKDIILNRLRNVRDDLETKTVLMRSTKLGGLELSEEAASKVLGLIQSELEAFSQKKIVLKNAEPSQIQNAEHTQISKDDQVADIIRPIGPISPIGPIQSTPPPSPTASPPQQPSPPKPSVPALPPPTLPIISSLQASLPKPPVVPPAPPKLPVAPPIRPTPTPPPPASRGRTEEGDIHAKPPVIQPIGQISPISPIGPIKSTLPPSPKFEAPASPIRSTPAPPPPTSRGRIEEGDTPAKPLTPPSLPLDKGRKTDPPFNLRGVRGVTASSPLKPKPGDMLDPEETEELRDLSHKIPRSAVNTAEIIARSLASLYEDANLTFDDPVLKARFETIAANRLKDIRDSIETRELLVRAVNLGGMGFSSEVRDRVATLLDKEFTKTKEELHDVKSREFQAQTRVRQEEKERGKLEGERKEKEDMDSRWQRLVKPRGEKKPIGPIGPISPIRPIGPIKSVVADPTSPQPQLPEPTPSLEDVKYTPRLVGPLEELKNFSIDDFRKLGAKPRDATARLQGKLDVLRGESMEKKISGVQALKASPLYKLYMSILAESLVQGKKPADIIAARRATAKETLSEEEFSAIMELSSALRY